ncbi:MAG: hypothetical protein OEY89_00440 [Gammaproteobacteria bacterium]|nr:hypothetical protein [Gammaproteobacteria bacterium]
MKRNIEELTIYRHVELSDEERNERLKSIIDEIDHRFSKVIDKPLMLELKSVLLEYRIREV